MTQQAIDISGMRFGRYLALSKRMKRRNTIGTVSLWLCRCDCGNEREVHLSSLRSGNSKSCGCLQAEITIIRSTKHGHASSSGDSPTYNSWRAMHDRCRKENRKMRPYYYDQGVTVCERWAVFSSFLDDMGERPPGRTLDRIDYMRGYAPDNCRWATMSEQAKNRRPRGTIIRDRKG